MWAYFTLIVIKIRAEFDDFQPCNHSAVGACTAKSCKSFIIVVTTTEKFSVIFPEFVFRTGADQGVAGRIRKCGFEVKNGTPGAIRTRDLLLRRQTLYPTELRVHTNNCFLIYYPGAVFSRRQAAYGSTFQ